MRSRIGSPLVWAVEDKGTVDQDPDWCPGSDADGGPDAHQLAVESASGVAAEVVGEGSACLLHGVKAAERSVTRVLSEHHASADGARQQGRAPELSQMAVYLTAQARRAGL